MAHNHENCTAPQGGAVCSEGLVFTYCDFDGCGNEYCSMLGHCECLCHSGKTCGCGHQWPKMTKGAAAVNGDAAATDPAEDPAPRPVTRAWAQALGDHVDDVWKKLWPPQ